MPQSNRPRSIVKHIGVSITRSLRPVSQALERGFHHSLLTVIVALVGLAFLASASIWVQGRAAGVGFASVWIHGRAAGVGFRQPVSSAKNFASRTTLSPLAGPITVTATAGTLGPTDYATLKDAFDKINDGTHQGVISIDVVADTTETASALLNASGSGSAAYSSITIAPLTAPGTISGNLAAPLIDLNGADNVTIEGRVGGAGTSKDLTIDNTNTSGSAIRFINDASNNTVKYAVVRGVNISPTGGVVLFSTTTGANGNDNNTVDNCDIRDGATTPANAVYSSGTNTTAAQNNSGNTISNSNIFNFYASTAVDSAGVRVDDGNTDWTITGNSFYQTASRAAVTGSVRAIYLFAGGNNFTVTNNFIGGSAPNAGGAAWTTTGTAAAYRFVGIQLLPYAATQTSVQGNTVKNFVWTSSSTASTLPGVWSGIYVQAGSVNIGPTAGNTIGDGTGTDSVSVTTSGTGGAIFGIGSGSGGTVAISNNTIGSITTSGTSAGVSASLVGIQVTAGANTISGNTVGSTTTVNSLNAATSSTSVTAQQVTGILSSSSSGATVTGNTVANLNNNYAGTSVLGQIRGILTLSGANMITGNTVRNLSTTSLNANATTAQSVYGIYQTSTTAGQTVSQNVVHSLSNPAASANVSVTGIYYTGAASGTNLIARNLVHSLAVSSTGTTSTMSGMQFAAGAFTAQNNMVRVGIDANGASTAGASIVRGIYDNGTTENRNFYHNSVYLGGTQTSGASNTFAFLSIGVTNARAFQNNIFVNARTNGGGTGKHYAVQYGGTTVNPTGLTASGNIFFVSGTGGVFGFYNGADRTTLAAWQSGSGQDATSAFVDPLFVNPTGDAAAVDLHLQASNPAEMGGLPVASVTDDYDGETRSGLTPTDIGADAGNFTSASGDIYAPAISYPLLSNGSPANRALTGFATIEDNSGTVSGGANSPRLYFKKSTDADVFNVPNDATGNGWKYVAATNAASPYSFTIDYSIINGGSVAVGDTIQYFVVAQDAANNLGSSPAGGFGAAANPPVQNINAHGMTNSYTIVGAAISGTNTVCASGCDYVSLTGALASGGIFADINSKVVTGNLVINISGDLVEDGTNGLNQVVSNDFPQTPTVTIGPSDGAMKTISGSVANGMIRLNGADRVTIDGRFNNSGRFLTFRNANTNNPTFTLVNDALDDTIRSSIIEGATTNALVNGVILFSTGATTGNDNNIVTDNQIRDRSDTTGLPHNLIYALGTSSVVSNSNNTISNNELFNFTRVGMEIVGFGNDSWTISGNTIYQAAARTTTLTGIVFGSLGTNTISGNTIRDLNTDRPALGIIIQSGTNITVARNRIHLFPSAAFSPRSLGGISNSAASPVTIVNNQITIIPSFISDHYIEGIRDDSQPGTIFNVYYNSVLIGGTATGSQSTWAYVKKNTSASTHMLRGNIFFNNRTGGTGSHFAAGRQGLSGTFSSNYNLFVGTGATPANFMDHGTSNFGTPVSFATWQSSTGGDANSSANNPGVGNFNTAMFVDPAIGDLHIVAAGNPLVSNMGTPVTGITTDYDNETRHATSPDIGSDESASPSAANGTISGRVLEDNGAPVAGVVINLSGTQKRKTITNAQGNYLFDGVETTGFYTVTPSRANYDLSPSNRSFSQLGNHTEASFNAATSGDDANALDTPEFFVRQQYVDILGREPDEGGFNYWSNEILHCGSDANCTNRRRRDIAAAFFIEQEFQQSGAYIYNLYSGALGRKPRYAEYASDRRMVVGGANLEAEKAGFAESFAQRADFAQKYQANTTADSFVDALLATVQQAAGVDLSSERATLISRYHTGSNQIQSRALVLRSMADNAMLKQSEYNAAFVLTEYFGYLRRDPEQGGYDFWLNVLNNREPGNFRGMVCSFITSTEYQKRFSSVVSRSNAECGQ